MPMLRYVYVLSLAVWLGGMIVLGAVVAPSVFQTLPALEPASGRALAGAAFGEALARFHYVAYGAGAVMMVSLVAMALLGPRPKSFAIRLGIVTTMLLVAAYSGLAVLGEIDGIQRQLSASVAEHGRTKGTLFLPSHLPSGDARRIRFDELHVLSTRLMMLNVAGALLLVFWEAREHGR
jgi:hypothetical protein